MLLAIRKKYTDIEWKYKIRYCLSFDKIISEKGYTKENIVLCTYRANAVKQDLTLEEIKKWLPIWYEKIINCDWLEIT